jgi:hypothetical protein
MATDTIKETIKGQGQDQEAAFSAAAEYTEKLSELQKKVAAAYIDSYERTSLTYADFQEETAKSARPEWLATAGKTQAELTRKVAKLQADFARGALR